MQIKSSGAKPSPRDRSRNLRRLADVISPQLFKALCDPNRIALLARLAECGRPCGVTELGACCEVDLSVTSRHLATLREAGVLTSTRRGKEIHYEVRSAEIIRTLRAIADAIEGCCGPPAENAGSDRGARSPRGKTKRSGRKPSPVARKERR
ncbi:MAG TPA: metalloregulator ArsR/SmtB family transcription factor [Candidatus Saccharimonadales bacterium]|nr:metalloregulator ArsR/SmtB family transcription factor [Candidatus Saccharimonadales bacterium]